MERGQNEPDRHSHIQEGNIIYGDKCSQRHKRGVWLCITEPRYKSVTTNQSLQVREVRSSPFLPVPAHHVQAAAVHQGGELM